MQNVKKNAENIPKTAATGRENKLHSSIKMLSLILVFSLIMGQFLPGSSLFTKFSRLFSDEVYANPQTPTLPNSGNDYFPNQNPSYESSRFEISYSDVDGIPKLKPGQSMDLKLKFKQILPIPVGKQLKSIQLVTSTQVSRFPFRIEKSQYYSEINSPNPSSFEADLEKVTVRDDATPGVYTLVYLLSYGKKDASGNWSAIETSQEISYINIEAGPNNQPSADDDSNEDPSDDDEEEEKPTNVLIQVKQGEVPRGKFGEIVPVRIPLINRGDDVVRVVTVEPVLSVETSSFPFELTQSDYTVKVNALLYPSGIDGIPLLENGSFLVVDYGAMQVREDVKTGYYKLDFVIRYQIKDKEYQETTQGIYFHLTGKPEEKDEDKEEVKIPVPRVLNKGFSTNPAKVTGGSNFTLTLRLRNQSTVTAVQNLRVNFTSEGETPAFLPLQGASSIFVPSIGVGQEQLVSMEFKCLSTITAGIYGMRIQLEYEDYKSNSYQSTETISIPVEQEDRLDFSSPNIQPPQITVGEDANLMFSIYNKGKTKLSNVTVKTPKGLPVTAQDIFPGNMDPGSSAEVDMMLHAVAANPVDKPIKLLITYEDAMGKEQKVEKEITLGITDMSGDEDFPGGPGGPGGMDQGKMPGEGEILLDEYGEPVLDKDGNPIMLGPDGKPISDSLPFWIWIIIGVFCIALFILIWSIIKKRREKKFLLAEDEEEEF